MLAFSKKKRKKKGFVSKRLYIKLQHSWESFQYSLGLLLFTLKVLFGNSLYSLKIVCISELLHPYWNQLHQVSSQDLKSFAQLKFVYSRPGGVIVIHLQSINHFFQSIHQVFHLKQVTMNYFFSIKKKKRLLIKHQKVAEVRLQ